VIAPRFFYASFMVLALLVFVGTRHFVPKPPALQRLSAWKRLALALAAFAGGTLGAKLPFALSETTPWWDATTWLRDGKTITTGLIGAYVAVEWAKWALGVHVKTGDTFALPLALALAVGRWGCFFNGCCYGMETTLPWGVTFYVEGQWMKCHPTQIYESAFHFSMALLLLELMRRDLLVGQRLKLYLIAYGVYRFLSEYLRPEPVWLLGLTFYQWTALVLALGLALQWLADREATVPTAVAT
jgi:prolipoprotein diacylglyceryltransferase